MSTGFWVNQDGLPLQFGTQKAIPELGGDYLMYGESREVEAYICLGNTAFGPNALQVPAIPSSFSGTGFPSAAGIQTMTTLFPLQPTAPVVTGNTSGILAIPTGQVYIDTIELEVLVGANAGTGGATGLTGIGLVTINPTTQAFVQVTPNAGVQLMGAIPNAAMATGATWTFRPNANGTATGGGSGWLQYSTAAITNTPVAPAWMGNVPQVTNAITPLPANGWISAIAAGGTYTGSGACGLLRLRIRYNQYGSISQ
jgi:hypothetical protein